MINKRIQFYLTAIISLFFFVQPINAQETLSREAAQELFGKGNAAYNSGDYAKAIGHYETITSKGRQSGALYYNLGNAYFKMGQIGKAILNYERARLFIPRDHDLRANHQFALTQAGLSREESDPSVFKVAIGTVAGDFTINELLVLLYWLFLIGCLVHLATLYFSWPRKWLRNILIILGVLILVLLTEFFYKAGAQEGLSVSLTDTRARFEPREEATTHFSLKAGEKVYIVKKIAGWSKIERLDKKAGWVERETVEQITSF